MSRLRITLPAVAAAALALAVPTAASAAPHATHKSPCHGAGLTPTAKNTAAVRHATLCLLNRQRTRHGLRRLRAQRSLTNVAGHYAHAMVDGRFFSHVSPGGSTMLQRIRSTHYLNGTRGWALGENLAWGAGRAATPGQIVGAWMRSPGHRANILNRNFREIGIGVALGTPTSRTGATYTTEFGRRAK